MACFIPFVAFAHCLDGHNIPHFENDPNRTHYRSVQSGDWDSPSTWDRGSVPTADSVVHIEYPDEVTIRNQNAQAAIVGINGTLKFDPTRNTTLRVITLMVLDDTSHTNPPGLLQIGTVSQPIDPTVRAEVIIRDSPIVAASDPRQFGTGLIACGNVQLNGAVKSPTFVEMALAQDPRAGSTTLSLAAPVSGWRAGDRLVIPDSRQLSQATPLSPGPYAPEEAILSSVSPDGRTLTLTQPLQHDHLGARNGAGAAEFMPHVGNLTRNIVIRSENPTGTRGHAMFIHSGDYRLRYAQFQDLGRTSDAPLDDSTFDSMGNLAHSGTNQRGRYSIHFHHVMGAANPLDEGYQFELLGSSVVDSDPSKWAVTIHNSHYGLIKDNVIYRVTGAAVMTEDGNESFNLLDHNFIVQVVSRHGGSDREGDGRSPDGFWLYNFGEHDVRNNVVANVQNFAYQYWGTGGTVRVPKYRGANVMVDGQYDLRSTLVQPIRAFTDNVTYSSSGGFKAWNLGNGGGYGAGDSIGSSIIDRLHVWHVNVGSYLYPTTKLVFRDLVVLGDARITREYYEHATGVEGGDYQQEDILFTGCRIEGQKNGIVDLLDAPNYRGSPSVRIENSYFRNHAAGIVLRTQQTPGTGSEIAARDVEIRNCKFDPLPGSTLATIHLAYSFGGNSDLTQRDQVAVYDYQQVPGWNFRLYYFEQLPEFVMPPSNLAWRMISSPVVGQTNLQNWNARGIAIGGEIAPSRETRYPEINGLLSSSSSMPAQPPVIFGPEVVFSSQIRNQATVTWYTNKPANSLVQRFAGGTFAPVFDPNPVVRHAVTLVGLIPGTEYQYTITSANGDGSRTTENLYFWTPANPDADTTPPPIEELRSSTDGTLASVTWRSSTEGSTSQVEYGFDTSYGSVTPIDTTLVGGYNWHLVNLTGLQPSRLYHARVRSKDLAGNEAVSADFTILMDQPPYNVDAGPDQSVTHPNSVALEGRANDDGLPNPPARLDPHWRKVLGPLGSVVTFGNDAAFSTTARFSMPGTYLLNFWVSDGQLNGGDTVSVTVLPSGFPAVTITGPRAGATMTGTVPITADASDETGVAGVQFFSDGAAIGNEDTVAPYSASWDTLGASEGSHRLTAVARDTSGNRTTSPEVLVSVRNSTAQDAPTITRQPVDVAVSEGQTATFSLRANGSAPLRYQWQWKSSTGGFIDIAGETSPAYQIIGSAASHGAEFRCVVSNSGGSVTSSVARLIVGNGGPTGNGALSLEMIDGPVNIVLQRKKGKLRPAKVTVPVVVRNISLNPKTKVTVIASGPGKRIAGLGTKKSKVNLKKGAKRLSYRLNFRAPGQYVVTVRAEYSGGVVSKQVTFQVAAPNG